MHWVLDWWPVLSVAVSMALAWGLWSIRRTIDERLSHLLSNVKTRQDAQEVRIVAIEERQRNSPSDRDIGMIREQLATLHGEIRTTGATMNGIAESQRRVQASTDRISDYLLTKGVS
jgi:hypothetical protein